MGVFQDFKIVQMVPNRANHHLCSHLCQSLFLKKVAGFQLFSDFKKTWLDDCNFNKKAILAQIFSLNFANFQKHIFCRTPPSDCFCFCVYVPLTLLLFLLFDKQLWSNFRVKEKNHMHAVSHLKIRDCSN